MHIDKVVFRKFQSESKEDEKLSRDVVPAPASEVADHLLILIDKTMSRFTVVVCGVLGHIHKFHVVFNLFICVRKEMQKAMEQIHLIRVRYVRRQRDNRSSRRSRSRKVQISSLRDLVQKMSDQEQIDDLFLLA